MSDFQTRRVMKRKEFTIKEPAVWVPIEKMKRMARYIRYTTRFAHKEALDMLSRSFHPGVLGWTNYRRCSSFDYDDESVQKEAPEIFNDCIDRLSVMLGCNKPETLKIWSIDDEDLENLRIEKRTQMNIGNAALYYINVTPSETLYLHTKSKQNAIRLLNTDKRTFSRKGGMIDPKEKPDLFVICLQNQDTVYLFKEGELAEVDDKYLRVHSLSHNKSIPMTVYYHLLNDDSYVFVATRNLMKANDLFGVSKKMFKIHGGELQEGHSEYKSVCLDNPDIVFRYIPSRNCLVKMK